MEEPDNRCEAVTKSTGQRCTRKATFVIIIKNSNRMRVCSQHSARQTVDEPWTRLDLPEPSTDLRVGIRNKLRRKLETGPSEKDGKGAIYVYGFEHERQRQYWKIGMTQQTVEERMRQWSAEHGVEIDSVHQWHLGNNVKFCERVIHLYLDHVRIHRYPIETEEERHDQIIFRSKWAATGKWIDDGAPTDRPVAKNKHVEWFCISLFAIFKIINAVVDKYGDEIRDETEMY